MSVVVVATGAVLILLGLMGTRRLVQEYLPVNLRAGVEEVHAEPIVWVLHVGYLWIVVGLALKALWLASATPIAAYWMHAVTAGAFGTMILGVMSRVALGHTGRALVVHGSIAAGYVLLSLGAAIRVFVAALIPAGDYVGTVAIGAVLWALAFAVFIVVYTPILVRPRVDEPDPGRLTPARDP